MITLCCGLEAAYSAYAHLYIIAWLKSAGLMSQQKARHCTKI